MSQEKSSTILDWIESVRGQYRRQDLRNDLEELGDHLEDLLVERALYEGLFEISISTDSQLRAALEDAMEQLREGDIEAVRDQIKVIEESQHEFESTLHQEVNDLLTKYRADVDSMCRLNNRLDAVESTDLQQLRSFLQPGHLEDDLEFDADAGIEDKIERAMSVAQSQRAVYENAVEEIFEPYLNDDDIGEIVELLLDEEDVRVADLSPNEFKEICDSELASNIELQLG